MSVLAWLLAYGIALGVPAHDEDTTPTPRERDRGGVRRGGDQETQTEEERKKREEEARKKAEEDWKKAEEEMKKSAGLCAAGCIVWLAVVVGGILISILILVWVYKDAKARGDTNQVLWMVLVFFTGLLGLLIYILARPKGEMGVCRNCQNKMMVTLTKCPHCGAGGLG